MANYFDKLYEEILDIRKYLIKLGPSRRQGSILEKKLNECKLIIQQYNTYLENINKIPRTVEEENKIKETCKNINDLYEEIISLTQQVKDNFEKMAFDLKIALNLLPVMTDDEFITRQLIDGIEYYSSVIDSASHRNLINFVLKSRLSQGAKLKLLSNYNTVEALLIDMKQILLPKKSASALQKQLLNFKQNEMTIDDFGRKLSELFVSLTISQSEGNSSQFNVLKTINEKQAIRQFCDGLRNRRISTIITAQKYECLKDAVQAAIEEDTSNSSNAQIFSMTQNNNNSAQNHWRPFNSNRRGYRGAYRRGFRQRGYSNANQNNQVRGGGAQPYRGGAPGFQQARGGFTSGYNNSGRYFNNRYKGNNYRGNFRGQVRVMTEELQQQPNMSDEQILTDCEQEFFRG